MGTHAVSAVTDGAAKLPVPVPEPGGEGISVATLLGNAGFYTKAAVLVAVH
jgi:hypothetical protein